MTSHSSKRSDFVRHRSSPPVSDGRHMHPSLPRDLVETAMRLYLDAPVELNDDVEIALSPSISFRGAVVWVNGSNCGVAFEKCSDAASRRASAAVNRQSARESGTFRPGPRSCARNGNARGAPAASDAAQRETRHDKVFVPGLRVKVLLGSGQERCAVVRWSRDNVAELFVS